MNVSFSLGALYELTHSSRFFTDDRSCLLMDPVSPLGSGVASGYARYSVNTLGYQKKIFLKMLIPLEPKFNTAIHYCTKFPR